METKNKKRTFRSRLFSLLAAGGLLLSGTVKAYDIGEELPEEYAGPCTLENQLPDLRSSYDSTSDEVEYDAEGRVTKYAAVMVDTGATFTHLFSYGKNGNTLERLYVRHSSKKLFIFGRLLYDSSGKLIEVVNDNDANGVADGLVRIVRDSNGNSIAKDFLWDNQIGGRAKGTPCNLRTDHVYINEETLKRLNTLLNKDREQEVARAEPLIDQLIPYDSSLTIKLDPKNRVFMK